MEFRFTAELWEYEGEAPWVFVTLPADLADEIDEAVPQKRGFGSVKVEVQAGHSKWSTSLFPDKSHGSFVLPVKRAIREAERISPGDQVTFVVRPVEANAD